MEAVEGHVKTCWFLACQYFAKDKRPALQRRLKELTAQKLAEGYQLATDFSAYHMEIKWPQDQPREYSLKVRGVWSGLKAIMTPEDFAYVFCNQSAQYHLRRLQFFEAWEKAEKIRYPYEVILI